VLLGDYTFRCFAPTVVAITAVLAVGRLLPGLPAVVRVILSETAVLIMVLGPRLLFSATDRTGMHCIEAQAFRRFLKERASR
jgi:hypothetical protein